MGTIRQYPGALLLTSIRPINVGLEIHITSDPTQRSEDL